ncbi:MAG: hypothetical protein ACRC6S_09430 [Shewanella sp.]
MLCRLFRVAKREAFTAQPESQPQTPGRPKGNFDVSQRLITAVLSLFSHRSDLRFSTGQIARKAEVDIALMPNEFGSKIGVFEQMVRETLSQYLRD